MATLPNRALWDSGRFAVVDVEGNGRQPPEAVEVAIITVDEGSAPCPHAWLLRPSQSISPRATRIHGITNADVSAAPVFADVAGQIQTTLTGRYLVAHHAAVDWSVLKRALPDVGPLGVLDTLKLARALLPGHSSYSLPKLVDALGLHHSLEGLDSGPHRALYDAQAALALLRYLADRSEGTPMELSRLVALGEVTAHASPEQQSLF